MAVFFSLLKFFCVLITFNLAWIVSTQGDVKGEVGLPLDPNQRPDIRTKPFEPPAIQALDPGKLVLTYLVYIGRQWSRPAAEDLNPTGQGSQDEQYFQFTRMQVWIYPHDQPAIPVNTQNTAWAVSNTLTAMYISPAIFPVADPTWSIPIWLWFTQPNEVKFAASRINLIGGAAPVDPFPSRVYVTHEYQPDRIPRNTVFSLITDMSRLIWTHSANALVTDTYTLGQGLTVTDAATGATLQLVLTKEGPPGTPITFGVLADGLRFMLVQLIKDNAWISDDAFFYVQGMSTNVAYARLRPAGASNEAPTEKDAPADIEFAEKEFGEQRLNDNGPGNPLTGVTDPVPGRVSKRWKA